MNPLMKYLLSNVLRRPEGEEGGGAPAADTQSESEKAFQFDPSSFFIPPAKEGSGADEGGDPPVADHGAQGGSEGSAAGASTSTEPTSPSSGQPDPAPKAGEEDPALAALRASVQAFLTKPAPPPAEATPQPTAPTTPQPAPQAPQGGAAPGPKYEFAVPDEVLEHLFSDEPSSRRRAVNGLLSGLANKLASDFGSMMALVVKETETRAVQAALQQFDARRSVEDVRTTFYSSHADLKKLVDNLPALDGVIWQTAHQIARATGKQGYDADLGNQVAATIRLQLGLPAASAPTAAPAAPSSGREPRRGTFSAGAGSGSRPNGAGDGNEFMAVVNAGRG